MLNGVDIWMGDQILVTKSSQEYINIFKVEFTLSSSSVKVGFTDITINILEKSHSQITRIISSRLRLAYEGRKASRVLLRNFSIF